MQYLFPVTATEKYSCLPNKLEVYQISSDQYFQHSFHYGLIGSHVFHGENHIYIQYGHLKTTKMCRICPLITGQYWIP